MLYTAILVVLKLLARPSTNAMLTSIYRALAMDQACVKHATHTGVTHTGVIHVAAHVVLAEVFLSKWRD